MMTTKQLFFNYKLFLPKKVWLLAIVVMLISSYNLSAQQAKVISGIVTSVKEGTPLPGVNVLIKGTATGVVTGFDGQFSINASSNNVLVFTYVGFQNKEITVGNQTQINVSLNEDTTSLDEVIVVGYGTQRKSDLTGAVSIVDVEAAKKTVSYDVGKMLQGRVAGVTVQSSGEPGGFVNIKIRGITSFNNNNPLFVIDGMIVDSPYDFAPGEIESMQVLKDASSAAIYGVRGANGVIIITTKKGKAGRIDLRYKTVVGFQNVPKKLSLTDRVGYQNITSAAEINAGLSVVPGNDPSSPLFIDDVNTDWQDAAYQTGVVQNHALTFSGGAENLNYSMNIDYFDNTSYVKSPQKYERLSTTLNLNGTKGKFKYGAKIGYTKSDKENFSEYLPGTSSIIPLLQAIPTMPVYDENRLGGYGGADNLTQRAITLNVIGFNNLIDNSNDRNRFIGNVWGELEIIKGLKYTIRASADQLDWQTKFFNPPSDLGWYYLTTNEESALDLTSGNETRTIVDNLLNYSFDVDKHKFDVLLGWVQERFDHKNHISRGVGFEPGEIRHIEYADDISAREYESTITSLSYISRLNYAYDDRYLLTANFRRDRSSLFPSENNTGDYFSISGAWKVNNESFITLPEYMTTLKIRGGYGQLGNNTIANYGYTGTVNGFASYVFGNTLAPGTTAVTLKDPNIKWEDTETINAAVEFGFFDNKLEFTTEYFQKKSTNLLADVPLPFSTGSFPASITTNAASVKNNGLEFTVSYNNEFKDFKYNVSANLGTLKNEVLQIGLDGNPIYGAGSKTEVGRSIGEIYVFEVEGIFQNQAEIDAHAFQSSAAPGDIKYRDLNDDGLITDDDRSFQGVAIPKYSFGLNFSSSYKNWDFSFFWQGSGGNKVLNGTYQNLMLGDYVNHHTDMLDYWTPQNTDTNIPRPVIGDPNGNNRLSSRFVENGDFIKLQNIELGFNVPLKDNNIVQRARVYASGQNVLTISKYKGYDPDFNNGGLFARGFDYGSFPNPRGFMFGVEVDF
ncbi:MAG: TonB-dependent receptor [Lutibacter sp.]|nr:TonB-dependent receptor [Lutibacter sp.]